MNTRLEVPIALLMKILSLDTKTGELMWRERDETLFKSERSMKIWNSRYAFTQAFTSIGRHGYKLGKIFGKTFSAHRVVFAMSRGVWPECHIDHINRIRTDNRPENLMDVTQAENNQNVTFRKSKSGEQSGVSFCAKRGMWRARIGVSGRYIHIGYFKDKSDAICARISAEELHTNTAHQQSRLS